MLILYKAAPLLFKLKIISAIIVFAVLLFYILPWLISELYFMPLRQDINDKAGRAPLRVEVNTAPDYFSNNFECFVICRQGKCYRCGSNNIM